MARDCAREISLAQLRKLHTDYVALGAWHVYSFGAMAASVVIIKLCRYFPCEIFFTNFC